jgi:hypothetical protein
MFNFVKRRLKIRRERRLRWWMVKVARHYDWIELQKIYELLSKPQKRGERRLRRRLFKKGFYSAEAIEGVFKFITDYKPFSFEECNP